MLAVTRLAAGHGREETLPADARRVLDALAARPGFLRGHLGRSLDEPALWVLVTEWESVGAYRRGLSGYDVKLAFADLMGEVVNEPSAFDVVTSVPAASTARASAGDE